MGKQESDLARQLMERAKPLIELYKTRAEDKRYHQRVRRCLVELTGASYQVRRATQRFSECMLDREHTDDINDNINIVFKADTSTHTFGRDLKQRVEVFERLAFELGSLSHLITYFTGVPAKPKKSRPALKYVSETRNLMSIYEEVTGKRVVFPKGFDKKTGEAYQPSTEFIRCCLQQIDAGISTANTITCIINARKQNEKIEEVLADVRSRK